VLFSSHVTPSGAASGLGFLVLSWPLLRGEDNFDARGNYLVEKSESLADLCASLVRGSAGTLRKRERGVHVVQGGLLIRGNEQSAKDFNIALHLAHPC